MRETKQKGKPRSNEKMRWLSLILLWLSLVWLKIETKEIVKLGSPVKAGWLYVPGSSVFCVIYVKAVKCIRRP